MKVLGGLVALLLIGVVYGIITQGSNQATLKRVQAHQGNQQTLLRREQATLRKEQATLKRVQSHVNDGLRTLVCYFEKRTLENGQLTQSEKQQGIELYREALAKVGEPDCIHN